MAKLTAWLVTLIGVLLVLALLPSLADTLEPLNAWLVPVLVLVIGVGKLTRNYSAKKRK
ncbi:MAG: hypothetical protein MUF61_00375 [archaeon]|jgi:membrane protein required for beta-lactamase induction|nr:hypothetical protein [archaeon]